ncbi:MAG: hypothetical protein QW689_05460 [Nitrososphaerota archaeon]
MTLERVKRQLEKGLRAKNPEQVIKQLASYFLQYLTPENLQAAIEQNMDITSAIYNHYGLTHPVILPVFRAAMRLYWREFEEFITNVPRLYQLLAKDPRNRPILETDRAKQYLNQQCENFYLTTYQIVWG